MIKQKKKFMLNVPFVTHKEKEKWRKKMENLGPLDLIKQMEDLKKQKELLQKACRRAGKEIKELKATVKALENTVEQALNPLRKDGLL